LLVRLKTRRQDFLQDVDARVIASSIRNCPSEESKDDERKVRHFFEPLQRVAEECSEDDVQDDDDQVADERGSDHREERGVDEYGGCRSPRPKQPDRDGSRGGPREFA